MEGIQTHGPPASQLKTTTVFGIWSLQTEMMHVFICILSREVGSDHKWSLKTHVEMRVNTRCKQTYLKLSTCDQTTQDGCQCQVQTGPKNSCGATPSSHT